MPPRPAQKKAGKDFATNKPGGGFLLNRDFIAMKTPTTYLVIAAFLFLGAPAFAKKNKKPPGVLVKLKDVPAPVQATFQTNASGGKVKEVEKETVNGQIIYLAEVKGTDGKWSKIYVKEAEIGRAHV